MSSKLEEIVSDTDAVQSQHLGPNVSEYFFNCRTRRYVLARVLKRVGQGYYGPTHYTMVEVSGLYWHLVDLIWIFLFPLLYLIH